MPDGPPDVQGMRVVCFAHLQTVEEAERQAELEHEGVALQWIMKA